MLPVIWRPEAASDLHTILDYISDRSELAAADLADVIEQATSQLPQHPYLYRFGRVSGTREMVVHPNYVVVYEVLSEAIEITSVLHARQQYP